MTTPPKKKAGEDSDLPEDPSSADPSPAKRSESAIRESRSASDEAAERRASERASEESLKDDPAIQRARKVLEDPIPLSLAAFEEVLAASRIGVEGVVTASIRSLGIFFSLAESVFHTANASFDQTYGPLASVSANRRSADGRGPDEKTPDAAALDRAGEEGRERLAETRRVVGRTWAALGESASEALRGFQDVTFLGFDLIEQNARDSANLTRALAAKTRRIATQVDDKTGSHHVLDVEDLQNLEQEAAEQQAELLGTIASRVAETSSVGIERSWKAAEGALTPLARQAEAAARLFTRGGNGSDTIAAR